MKNGKKKKKRKKHGASAAPSTYSSSSPSPYPLDNILPPGTRVLVVDGGSDRRSILRVL